jgi:hypothetical protein
MGYTSAKRPRFQLGRGEPITLYLSLSERRSVRGRVTEGENHLVSHLVNCALTLSHPERQPPDYLPYISPAPFTNPSK